MPSKKIRAAVKAALPATKVAAPTKAPRKGKTKAPAKAPWQPYKVRAEGFAKTDSVKGSVLKKAFPKLDAEGLKTLRRRMRAAIRAGTPEGKVLAAHKLGVRWLVSDRMRAAADAISRAAE